MRPSQPRRSVLRRSVLDRIARLLERPLVIREPFARLDAIVVLGAPLDRGGALSSLVLERVVAAAAGWLSRRAGSREAQRAPRPTPWPRRCARSASPA